MTSVMIIIVGHTLERTYFNTKNIKDNTVTAHTTCELRTFWPAYEVNNIVEHINFFSFENMFYFILFTSN